MRGSARRSILFAAALTTLLLLPFWLPTAMANGWSTGGPESADAALADAFERARSSPSVRLTADVEMRRSQMVGGADATAHPETSALRVEGTVVRPDRWSVDRASSARLRLLAGTEDAAVELLMTGGRAYVGHEGRWTEVENPLEGTAPGGDYLGYLSAAQAVTDEGRMETAAGPLTRYGFDIDGPRYAEHVRQQTEFALLGQLPDGVQLAPSPALVAMTGHGELWVDSDGLPRREIIDLAIPRTGGEPGSQAHMVVDFSGYGEPVEPIVAPAPGPDGVLRLPEPSDGATRTASSPGTLPQLPLARFVLLALAAGFCSVVVRHRAHRNLYTAVVLAVTLSMVGAPLLQAGRMVRFRTRMARAAPFEEALADVGLVQDADSGTDAMQARMSRTLASSEPAVPRDCRNLYPELDGSADEDGDGLTNETEWCLGTAYDNRDTDFDTITDTVELAGFDYGDSHWLLDPLRGDTNQDGLDDGSEWAPNTTDDEIDFDGDGVPNAWDDDNDDDGVADDDDLSPYRVLQHAPSFDVHVTGHYTDTAVYVDVQVQPEDISHLRYGMPWFDWPSDDRGQIKDLDGSLFDVRLIPVLAVTSSIDPSLASAYGVSRVAGDGSGGHRLLVPLQAVGSGGRIAAFGARLAFTSAEADRGIDLTEGKLLWLTQAALDDKVDQAKSEVSFERMMVAAYAEDSIRLTGMHVTQSTDAKVALFGTTAPTISTGPGVADEAKVMFNLMAGLTPSFLAFRNPSLDEFVRSFDEKGAAIPFKDTWGVDPRLVFSRLDTYSHRDAALATTGMTTTGAFLDDHYVACSEDTSHTLTPTVAIAYQETSGHLDINNSHVQIEHGPEHSFKPVELTFPLASAGVVVMRRVQLAQYGCSETVSDEQDTVVTAWQSLSTGAALAEIERRYAKVSGESFIGLAELILTSYLAGRSGIVDVNGHVAWGIGDMASAEDLGLLRQPGATSLAEYVRQAYQLDRLLLSADVLGAQHGFRDWSSWLGYAIAGGTYVDMFVGQVAAVVHTIVYLRRVAPAMSWYVRALWANNITSYTNEFGTGNFPLEIFPIENIAEDERTWRAAINARWGLTKWPYASPAEGEQIAANITYRNARLMTKARNQATRELLSGNILENMHGAENDILDVSNRGATVTVKNPTGTSKWYRVSAIAISALVMVTIVLTAWIAYWATEKAVSGVARDQLLATTLATMYLAILQFIVDVILALIPLTWVSVLLTIVVLIAVYVVVGAISGDWNPLDTYNRLTTWLAEAILDIDFLAQVPKDGVASSPPSMTVSGESTSAWGAVVSTTYEIRLALTTTLEVNADIGVPYDEDSDSDDTPYYGWRQATDKDVKDSWSFASIVADEDLTPDWAIGFFVTDSVKAGQGHLPASDACDDTVRNSSKSCYNEATIGFTAASSGRDLSVPLLSQMSAKQRYEKCVYGVVGWFCSVDTNYAAGPGKPARGAPQDQRDQYEKAKQTLYIDVLPVSLDELFDWGAPDEAGSLYGDWNTDHDGDMVTDAHEAELGTNPRLWDTDGDLLSDGVEVGFPEEMRSDALKSDTDGDGLDDGLELRLSTAPDNADSDGDGLTDGEEVCHMTDGEIPSLAGGWAVRQVDTEYWTCSDPNKADADGDLLLDGQERDAGTSPYAPNTAPGLSQGAEPSVRHGGADYTALRPGDPYTVTLRLDDTTSEQIDRPMSLEYEQADLGELRVHEQTAAPAEYTPPVPQPVAGGLHWDFGGDPLMAAESMTSTLGGSVPLAVTESRRTTLEATLAYTDPISQTATLVTSTQQVLIDVDDPASAIMAPSDGQRVRGAEATVLGTASDPTTWPEVVDVRISGTEYPGGTARQYDTGWQAAEGMEDWAYDWTLPADGVFEIESQATDYLGYVETPGEGVEVVVDSTPPGAGFTSVTDGDVLKDIDGGMVTIRGTATDLLSGAPKVAGLRVVQLSIDGRPWRNVAEFFAAPHPAEADWEHDWRVLTATYGDHVLAVRAVDALGQIGEPTEIRVTVDTLAPGDILSNARPDVSSAEPVTLLGHVDDEANVQPPARPVSLETGPVQASEVISGATTWLMPDGPTTGTLSAVWLGDVDGDRRADLAVGTPHKRVDDAEDAGRVSILYGRAGGWPVPPEALAVGDSPSSFVGGAGSQLGARIAAAGDVNADGLSDLLIGDPEASRVYLVFGRIGPMGRDTDVSRLHGPAYGALAKVFTTAAGTVGEYVGSAGDVNGDGYDDLLIGATGLSGNMSRVYVVLGSDPMTGALGKGQQFVLDGTRSPTTPAVVAAVLELDGGIALATGVGDVNDDQFADFAVLAPNEAVYVILGSGDYQAQRGLVPLEPETVAAGSVTDGPPDGKHLIALGDVNGDGLTDMGYSAGSEPRVVYGRTEGWTTGMSADATFSGYRPVPNGFLAGVGDVNDDGLSDLLLGTLGGRAFLVHGSSDLATSQPVAAVLSNAADAASAPYAAGADGNCDGSSDLLVVPRAWGGGAPIGIVGASDEGDGTDALGGAPGNEPASVKTTDALHTAGARSADAASTSQRSLRPELSLGPSTAPRSLSELPTVWHDGAAGALGRKDSDSPMRGGAIDSVMTLGPADGTPQRLASTPTTLYVDDDYCATCANDGHTWGTDAFATIQDGLDAAQSGNAATLGDTVLVGPGVYRENAAIHAGKDYVTLRGVDPDAVFVDAGGGLGIEVFPPSEHSPSLSGIEGVTIDRLTIRNASTAIEVNYGGTQGEAGVNDPANIRIRNVAIQQTASGSTGIAVGNSVNRSASSVDIRHNTLVANASLVKLVHVIPGAVTGSVFLRDNLFVALPNASPAPQWYDDDDENMQAVRVNDDNGFASQTGSAGDWADTPAGNNATLMTLTGAAFQDVASENFRVGGASEAHGLAGDGGDLGYYTYHGPVWVDPTYCDKCDNDGRTWGSDAYASVQAAIDSGAWKVSLDPGAYRERVHLVNGVKVYGSGAGLTALAPPDDSAGALVGAEGVRGAYVALLTLAGGGHDDGLRLEAGAHVTLKRSIVRDTVTGVAVDGTAVGSGGGATATLLNDTLVGNETGVAATRCGNVDVDSTILAYHAGTALAYEPCATTKLHTYDLYWRNGRDLDDGAQDTPTPGEVYADPRLTDPSHNDYRPLPDSPAVDAGDPRRPHPPGTGKHVDIGYVQSAAAAVYVSGDYCPTCLNDGLEWQVDAFDTIQEGIDHVPDAAGIWTVGVAPGTYAENAALKSGVRLVGSGADWTEIDGGGATALTMEGVTNVEVRGFSLLDGGIWATGASNKVKVTHNVIADGDDSAVRFDGGSTGVMVFNTVAYNLGTGLELAGLGTWVHARFNIIAGNDVGIDDGSQAQVFNSYNLLHENGTDVAGTVALDDTTVYADPSFAAPEAGIYSLELPSPAADAIPLSGYQPVPVGGGDRADLGYQELLAVPAVLMMGKEGERSCGMGASGVDALLAAVVKVDDASESVEETAPPSPLASPGSWTTVTISDTSRVPGTNKNVPASYWSWRTALSDGDGLYRLYTVPTDAAGNASSDPGEWYRSRFVADSQAPDVTLTRPSEATSTAPAIRLATVASDTVDTGSGQRNNLARVYFEVDGAVVTATRGSGATGQYETHTALTDGTHTIKAVAVDRAGNVGESEAKSLTVSTPRNEAALVVPAPGSAVTQTTVRLVGYAHFTSTDGDGQVQVRVDGGAAVVATVEEPKAKASRWTAQATLSGDGDHVLTMTAQRSTDPAGAHDTESTLRLDTTSPALTVVPQARTVALDVTFTGTASDTTSGVAAVEVSTDGGFSWQAAGYSAGTWAMDWTVPLGTDYARFPLRVRATDAAGNTMVKADTFVADNLGPTPIRMTTVDPAEGRHVVAPAQVRLAWSAPVDGSGEVKILAAADRMTDTVPTGSPLTGDEYAAQLDQAGTWYVHLLAQDEKGNSTLRHYGPWYVESTGGVFGASTVGGDAGGRRSNGGGEHSAIPSGAHQLTTASGELLQAGWQSSIRVDGRLHVGGDEWLMASERMDVDPRPREPQDLWASFDQPNLYLGWRGANWGIDGNGYVYLDTGAGGTTEPMAGTGATALPIEADALVEIRAGGGTLYRHDGSGWQPATDQGFASVYGAHGETEVVVPRSAIGGSAIGLGLVAHTSVHGVVASVFPTDNATGEAWESAYRWDRISSGVTPNETQPAGHHARIEIDSRESPVHPLGPGSTVRYLVEVENLDHEMLPGVTLVLTASEGLRFEELAGGGGPAPGEVWPLSLGDLEPGSGTPTEITARLADDLTGINTVSVEAALTAGMSAAEPALARGTQTHDVDTTGPVVRYLLPREGATMRSGAGQVRGTAHDSDGIGVSSVEVRVDDGPWSRAQGAVGWTADIEVPASGVFELSARAVDAHGNAGAVQSVTVAADDAPPAVELSAVPQVATAHMTFVSGTARDGHPDGGPIARVEVQLDDGRWLPANGTLAHDADGTATWRTQLALTIHEGIGHSVRARAVDQAGNVGAPSPAQRFTVDNRGPRSLIEEPKAGVVLAGDGQLLVWGHAFDGWGIETVEVSADGGRMWHRALLGADAARLLGQDWPQSGPAEAAGPNAVYLPTVSKHASINEGSLWAIELTVPSGRLALRSRATDRAGNVEPLGLPVRVTLSGAESDSDLAAKPEDVSAPLAEVKGR